jgi:hypothetical protein
MLRLNLFHYYNMAPLRVTGAEGQGAFEHRFEGLPSPGQGSTSGTSAKGAILSLTRLGGGIAGGADCVNALVCSHESPPSDWVGTFESEAKLHIV